MDEDARTREALFKLAVLGPLISARLEHGDIADHIRAAAARTYQRPDGRFVRLSAKTIESWFYAWRAGGLDALRPRPRADRGASRSIRPELADWLLRAKRERPRRSIRRLIKLMIRAGLARDGELSKSSVHRLLKTHDISERPARHGDKERRAFLHGAPSDLWMADVMHSRAAIAPDGRLRKVYLHVFIDSATRLVPHAAFRFGEKAHDFEAVFKQAVMKYGPPCALYVDRGAAQVSESLALICAEIRVQLLHTEARDAPAKAGVERVIRTLREEVEDELPEQPLPLAELNSLLWSWFAAEYHVRQHQGTGRVPLEHWLALSQEQRRLPPGLVLDEVFLHRTRRTVRKDGTVRWGDDFLEVRFELVGLVVELRHDPERPEILPRVFRDGRFVCDAVPLDKVKNSLRPRRRRRHSPEPGLAPTGLDPLDLIRKEHHRRARPPRS